MISGRELVLVALLLVPAAARADGQRGEVLVRPPSAAEQSWGDALARAMELPLVGVEGVSRQAMPDLRVPGYKVVLERATILRLQFPDADQARAEAAQVVGGDAAVCQRDPRWITTLPRRASRWGESLGDSGPLLALLDQHWPPGEEPPLDLARRLREGPETSRERIEAELVENAIPAWEGARARLRGVVIERRRLADAEAAERMASGEFRPVVGARVVMALRGAEVFLAHGEAMADASTAARALASALVGRSAEGVGAYAPKAEGGRDGLVAVAWISFLPRGTLHEAGASTLRMARKEPGDQNLEGIFRWRFVDPGVRNHVLMRSREGLFVEARVTSTSMLSVLARTEAEETAEKAYLVALLAELGQPLPPAQPRLVELVEPAARER